MLRNKVLTDGRTFFELRRSNEYVAYVQRGEIHIILPELVTHLDLISTLIHEDLHAVIGEAWGKTHEMKEHKIMKQMEPMWF